MKDFFLNNSIASIEYSLAGIESPKPLDVILDMIKDAKINIRDIFISNITDQYLKYIENIEERDYEYLSEFLVFAATLLEVKSSALLPKIDIYDQEEELMSPQEKLILQLENYKLFKEASQKLENIEILNRFYREPKFTEDDYRFIIKDFNLDKLINAFKSILEKVEYQSEVKNTPKTIEKERFTVSERVKLIISLIRSEKQINFYSLFTEEHSKIEVINTFLAILEVLKRQVAIATQNIDDWDIILYHNVEMDVIKDFEEEILLDVEEKN